MVGDIRHDLRVAHRLIVRAHDAEREFAPACTEGERRDDGVHRPLARAERIGMVGIDDETGTPVGQHDAGLLRADTHAEMGIKRIDQRNRHSVPVDHCDVHRVAIGRRSRAQPRHAPRRVDPTGEPGREVLVE